MLNFNLYSEKIFEAGPEDKSKVIVVNESII